MEQIDNRYEIERKIYVKYELQGQKRQTSKCIKNIRNLSHRINVF